MVKKEVYEIPELEFTEVFIERGFAASASSIDNPDEEAEDSGYWN